MANVAPKPSLLSAAEAQVRLASLPGWSLSVDGKAIAKQYRFPDFISALAFVNQLGETAEAANHHPDLTLGWGYVGVTYTTHDAGGLRDADFIMATKTEQLIGDRR